MTAVCSFSPVLPEIPYLVCSVFHENRPLLSPSWWKATCEPLKHSRQTPNVSIIYSHQHCPFLQYHPLSQYMPRSCINLTCTTRLLATSSWRSRKVILPVKLRSSNGETLRCSHFPVPKDVPTLIRIKPDYKRGYESYLSALDNRQINHLEDTLESNDIHAALGLAGG